MGDKYVLFSFFFFFNVNMMMIFHFFPSLLEFLHNKHIISKKVELLSLTHSFTQDAEAKQQQQQKKSVWASLHTIASKSILPGLLHPQCTLCSWYNGSAGAAVFE